MEIGLQEGWVIFGQVETGSQRLYIGGMVSKDKGRGSLRREELGRWDNNVNLGGEAGPLWKDLICHVMGFVLCSERLAEEAVGTETCLFSFVST